MALSNIYLLQYNNYFNRKVKRLATPAEYIAQAIHVTPNASFNPGDGVTAQHAINNGIACDYCVVTNQSDTEIESRWFVVESQRLRNGQYQYTLYRDIFADYLDNIKESTCFINKGYVPQTSPLIFNNENMGFNQIKQSETLLKNKLGTPWVVAYLSRYDGEGNYNKFTGSFKSAALDKADYVLTSLSDYTYYQAGMGYAYLDKDPDFMTTYGVGNEIVETYVRKSGIENIVLPFLPDDLPTAQKPVDVANPYTQLVASYNTGTTIQNGLPVNTYSGRGTVAGFNTLAAENGKIIKAGEKYYRIVVDYTSEKNVTDSMFGQIVPANSALGQAMTSALFPSDNPLTGTASHILNLPNTIGKITLSYAIVDAAQLTYNITYNGTVTRDAVYEVIGTPLNNVTFTVDASGTQFVHDGDIGLEWFQDIANRYKASGYCMDVQIVPYAPIDSTDVRTQQIFYCGTSASSNLAIGFKFPRSSFTVANTVNIPLRDDKKIGNECDLFRLCSPNGIGNFDFNPYKNGGFASFEADVTLLPINPYIKVHPIWNELYGNGSIEDYRGLICGGDFSIGNTSNEWLTYQQQNKYYQDIFNRNIESQEVNNNISRERERWDVATGVLGGAVSGGTGGALVGGIPGAIAGAIVGAGSSALAGAKDIQLNERQRSEAIQLQKDQFGYQLGTVKARTTQLSKTTAFNINNKYFPYVEYWTCTPEEVEALKNKIKYNGMTVGVIGKLKDFINPNEETFVQASLIEIDITDDTHLANAIARNLSEGIRI